MALNALTPNRIAIPAAEEAEGRGRPFLCFTEDGTVHDEGRDYRGRDAIVNGSSGGRENTDTFCRWSTRKRMENEVTVPCRLTGESLESR